jgi:hypothetical protein
LFFRKDQNPRNASRTAIGPDLCAFSCAPTFSHAPGFLTGDEEDGFFIAESDVSRFFTDDEKFGYVNTSGRVIWGPTKGSPDHAPLLGWSDDEKAASCEGISESIKAAIARLFPR